MADLLDPVVIALTAGAVLAVYLVALEAVTLVYVRHRNRVERRKEGIEPELRAEIVGRLDTEAPNWEPWAEGLSDREREVAETVLDRYLRTVDGAGKARLQEGARALGVDERSRAQLRGGDYYDRLIALGWLALLEATLDSDALTNCCDDDAEMRAAAARVLYEGGAPDAQTAGTRLLLGAGSERMTVFGMDTLYRLNRRDPGVLFEYASDHASSWSDPVLAQVLLVVAQFTDAGADRSVDWIVDALWLGSETVRVQAVRALAGFGWRRDVRDRTAPERLVEDPSPAVRRAACEMLGAWQTEGALGLLETVATTDADQRVRVCATEKLVKAGEAERLARSEGVAALRWVTERAAAGQGDRPWS